MGLDIAAYRKLTKIDNPELDNDGYPVDDTCWQARRATVSEEHFPGRAAGIEPDGVYRYKRVFCFRAGSYSGYNDWRGQLAHLAGYGSAMAAWAKPPPGGPFIELINFTDCEGVIGPVVAAKLAKDFAAFRSRAAAINNDWFFDLYCEWQKAFEMAADDGAVEFG